MNLLDKKYILTLQLLTLLTLMIPAKSFAGNSWLDKGTNLLKSFGVEDNGSELTLNEIGAGLKEALRVGSQNVVTQLGAQDGFNKDSNIHIPLPKNLDTVKTILNKVGMSFLFEDLELKLNRAAEQATPKAKQLFFNAITAMTFQDINKIYNGPDDAATKYFKESMSPELSKEIKPVIEQTLSQVGAVSSYDAMMNQYKSLPFVPDVKADLTNHVIEKALDGLFYY
jgi:hypothetical protein